MVNPIPENFPRISVALSVDGAAEAIDFYVKILGMTERERIDMDGKVGHSELELGDSLLMVADEFPEIGFVSPKSLGGTPVTVSLYVTDVDATFAAALAAGATELRPLEDKFYGDRSGQFEDPWGHRWSVASRVEDLTAEEIHARAQDPDAPGLT